MRFFILCVIAFFPIISLSLDKAERQNAITFYQKLKNCESFSYAYKHPIIADFLAKKTIYKRLGDGRCQFTETMPGETTLNCAVSQDTADRVYELVGKAGNEIFKGDGEIEIKFDLTGATHYNFESDSQAVDEFNKLGTKMMNSECEMIDAKK
jgi:hypothetical protein